MAEQLRQELTEVYKVDMLVDVRIIRDRGTGASKGFGFATFADKPSAMAFMDKHHAEIELGRNGSNGRRWATLSYAEERGS